MCLCVYVIFTVYVSSAIWLVQPVDRESQIMHKNVMQVKPERPSVGGGAGKPD